MKRHGDLFGRITSFQGLLQAARTAYRGKRLRPQPAAFHYDLERNLLDLQDELRSGGYRPGPYRAFRISDPKPRLISAAPYRDRVVHHAVCRVIEPLFDRTFIYDTYANRLRKGTHRALDRATTFCRQARYVLKCDVEKFFPSIDHDVLLGLLARKIKCSRTLDLLARIIHASNPQEPVMCYFPGDDLFAPQARRHGIPIGNLTSQFFANVMLDPLDHHLKEDLRWCHYLRFADDFLAFGDDKRSLHALLVRIRERLAPLRLRLHARKCVVLPVSSGVPFLGWRLFPDHRRLCRSTGVRFQRRLRELVAACEAGELTFDDIRPTLASWVGHPRHGDTWGLRRRLFAAAVFRPSADRAATAHDGAMHRGT